MGISEDSIFVRPKTTHLRVDHKYEFVLKFGIEGGEEVRSRTCTLDTQQIVESAVGDTTEPNSGVDTELEALANLQGYQVKIVESDEDSNSDSDFSASTSKFDHGQNN